MSRPIFARIGASLLLFAVAGCGAAGPDVRTVTLGDVCVEGDTIRVRFRECLSSSCDTLVSAGCDATWSDGTVLVTGEAVIERRGTTCTDDCGFIDAACDLPAEADPATDDLVFASASRPISELGDCAALGL